MLKHTKYLITGAQLSLNGSQETSAGRQFNYYHPITVRYADLDTQGHVNNASFITYVESARMAYYQAVGVWDGQNFNTFGMVVAEQQISYLKPIRFGQELHVGLGVSHMGTKSLEFSFQIEESSTGMALARGKVVMVAYDPEGEHSIPIPPAWREKINLFEKREERNDTA